MIKALLQYNGAEVWLSLPASKVDFQNTLREINAVGADSFTVERYETDIAALPTDLLTNADVNLVSYLAARMADMNGKELAALEAVMESPYRLETVERLIEYTYNKDSFLFRPGVSDATTLGRAYVYDSGLCQMPEEWKGGIDLERFGAHAAEQERGAFTSKGYIMPSGDELAAVLTERGIPAEYRLR